MKDLIEECAQCLENKELTIAFAESVTSGALCYEFGMVPGSGKIFMGGLVSYDGELKKKYLGVTNKLIEEFTPESAEVTAQMAKGLISFTGADICVAVTGLSTEGGSETEEKPVGTIFSHIIFKEEHYPSRKVYTGNAEEIIKQAVEDIILEVLKLIRD